MEKFVSLKFPVLSLEDCAFFRLAIIIWNQEDTRNLLVDYINDITSHESLSYNNEKISNMLQKVKSDVSKLLLLKFFEKKLYAPVKIVGDCLLDWLTQLRKHIFKEPFPVLLVLDNISWTFLYCIDKEKTIQGLIKNEKLNLVQRFQLANGYCFESDARKLWEEIQVVHDGQLSDNIIFSRFCTVRWCFSTNENQWNENFNGVKLEENFKASVVIGNLLATKYFVGKMTAEQRQKIFNVFSKSVIQNCHLMTQAEVIHFLLSKLSDRQFLGVVWCCSSIVVSCYLLWPWLLNFLEFADLTWDNFSKLNHCDIVCALFRESLNSFYHKNVLILFWNKSPEHLRNITVSRMWWLLLDFDMENDNPDAIEIGRSILKLFLDSTTESCKTSIIFDDAMKAYCYLFVWDDKRKNVEFLIQECIMSKELGIQWCEELREDTSWQVYLENMRNNELFKDRNRYNQCLSVLDDIINSQKQGRTDSPAHRPRCRCILV